MAFYRWILVLQLLPFISFGQKEVSNWYFGAAALDFNCSPVKPISQSVNFYPLEGCSSISDQFGNLLFYTDGHTVFDKSHQVMLNGFDIGLDTFCYGSSTQGVLIVKQPLQDSIYYIFTTDCAENKLMNGFCYSIVNMNLNSGRGKVIVKKQLLLPKTCEKLAATRHSNGIDTWIVTHEWGTSNFVSFLLTSSGLNLSPVVSSAGRIQLPADPTDNYPAYPYPEAAARGHLKFSPQGNRLIALSTSDCHPNESHAELFSFDNTTGAITHDFNIYTSDSCIYYGASFSPDGHLLYVSAGWYGNLIHQFDLNSYDSISVANSKYIVFSDTSQSPAGFPSALQIGPDGKIYNATNTQALNIIASPNQYGLACNFQLNAIQLSLDSCWFASSQYGLPNNDESYYLNSFTGTPCSNVVNIDFQHTDSCAGSPVSFYDNSTIFPFAINNWKWEFGDPLSGPADFSNQQNPQHTFSFTGLYQVKLIVYSDTSSFCKVDSIVKPVTINCIDGIDDISDTGSHSLLCYPNPVSEFICFKAGKPIQTVKIYNCDGKLVHAYFSNSCICRFDIAIENGLYFAEVSINGQKIFKKFIVSNCP
jgi:PKD repeat protein